jgi:predicted ATPase/DNA-binding SARP family transcriptional activator
MEFRLLGQLEVLADDSAFVPSAPKVRALLAILLLHANELVSADRLIDDLWSGDPPARAVKVLQTYISQLRAALGAERIVTRSPGYLLRVGENELDLARFERLRAAGKPNEALALWRGAPLADFAYEPWAQPEIAALEERRLATLEERLDGELASGRHAFVVAELEALVEQHPLREQLRGQLMLALYRCGRQAEALAAYRDGQQRLVDELGLQPGSALRSLERAILRQDTALESLPLRGQGRADDPRRFIGRRRELAQLRGLLERERLVTITGPGGAGKTRLAFELVRDHPSLVCVELAAIRDADLLAPAILRALGLADIADASAEETLAALLARRELLLVLDNFEQLAGAAPLLTRLLQAAPRLSLLVTSRSVLHLPDEARYDLPPLQLPDQPQDLDAFEATDSVALFADRAAASRPGFAVTSDNAPAIGELCARLDGLPLALELAGARINLLSPAAIVARLGRRLDLLKATEPQVERHATLRAAVEWSYELLADDERRLFSAFSVFTGGFTADAAEAVAGVDVLDGLVALLDASLVRAEGAVGDEPRFGMLETIREYARERLTEQDDAADIERRHAHFFAGLAEHAEPGLRGPQQVSWLERLDADRENLLAALLWAEDAGGAEVGLAAAASLWRYWQVRGEYREGRAHLDRLLAFAEHVDREIVADALLSAGRLAFANGDHDVARRLIEESLGTLRELGDRSATAFALLVLALIAQGRGDSVGARSLLDEATALAGQAADWWTQSLVLGGLGDVLYAQGEWTAARRAFEEAVRAAREAGDTRNVARASTQLATVVLEQGDHTRATRLLEEALPLQRALGDRFGIPRSLQTLGLAAQAAGDDESAAAYFQQVLTMYLDVDDRLGVASSLDCLAAHSVRHAQLERAARLYAAATVLRQMGGQTPMHYIQPRRDETIEAVAGALGAEAFADAWSEGRSLTIDEAADYAKTDLLLERSV